MVSPSNHPSSLLCGTIDKQLKHGDTVFPCVVDNPVPGGGRQEALAWVREHRDELLEGATRHGAVLFADFPLPTVEAFDALIQALALPSFPYRESLSNAVRVNRTERVFSANEAPPEVQIFFHHEMAQTPVYPRYILFYCEIPASQGGATPICRSDVLYERLKQRCPEFIAKCEARGLRYTHVMPGADDPESGMGRSWQSTLAARSPAEAEARLRELGYTWEWQGDRDGRRHLKVTTPTLPAVMEISPGRKTFFNQLIAAYCGWKDTRNDPSRAIRHGDGSILDAGAVKQAIEIAEDLAFHVAWRAGDAVLIDNAIAMHGRMPFQGTRKVVASLTDKRIHRFARDKVEQP